ncbi:MAG: hypothetical protein AB2536_16200 [Candidatus Thiodiazotropha endolucinida]
MKNEEKELFKDQYKDEISSIKRIAVQISSLYKWFLNVTLASLAFAFSVMFQIKGSGLLPDPLFAKTVIVLLLLATAVSIYIRIRYELYNFAVDSKIFINYLPALRDYIINLPKSSEEDIRHLDHVMVLVNSIENAGEQENNKASLYADVLPIILVSIFLVSGICSLSFYIWQYFFNV